MDVHWAILQKKSAWNPRLSIYRKRMMEHMLPLVVSEGFLARVERTHKAPKLRIQPADILDLRSILAFQSSGIGITAKTKSVSVDTTACSYPRAMAILCETH